MWTIFSRSIKMCQDVFTDLKFWEKHPSNSIALANLSWGERLVCMFHPTIQESNGPLVETNHSSTLPNEPPPVFHVEPMIDIWEKKLNHKSAVLQQFRCCFNEVNFAFKGTSLQPHKPCFRGNTFAAAHGTARSQGIRQSVRVRNAGCLEE